MGELEENDWKEPVPWRGESAPVEGKLSAAGVQEILDALVIDDDDELEDGAEYATDVSDMVEYGNGYDDDGDMSDD